MEQDTRARGLRLCKATDTEVQRLMVKREQEGVASSQRALLGLWYCSLVGNEKIL